MKKFLDIQIDLDIVTKKNKELEERLLEKNRQMQTMQVNMTDWKFCAHDRSRMRVSKWTNIPFTNRTQWSFLEFLLKLVLDLEILRVESIWSMLISA